MVARGGIEPLTPEFSVRYSPRLKNRGRTAIQRNSKRRLTRIADRSTLPRFRTHQAIELFWIVTARMREVAASLTRHHFDAAFLER